MNKSLQKELEARADDLTKAIQIMSDIAADNTVTPKRRLERITGICQLYVAMTKPATTEEGKK